MLTCKVGETIINCIDGKYDKYTLKQWSDKNKLICPDCNKPYEYCHGEINEPYFRHKEKNKECEGIYSESETQEHIQGKKIIYRWLLKLQEQGVIQNVKLESYIPETKQRPDIYFEQNGKRYVIEFQCSPIATEYMERHRLYQLANVNDLWILGIEKYNIIFNEDGVISHKYRYKVLEEYANIYLLVNESSFIIENNIVKQHLPYHAVWLTKYLKMDVDNFTYDFERNTLKLTNQSLDYFIEQDKVANEIKVQEAIKDKQEYDSINELIIELNNQYKKFKDGKYFFEVGQGYYGYYKYRIHFNEISTNSHFGSNTIYTFFVKEDKADCCVEYEYSRPFTGKKGGLGWRKCTGYKSIYTLKYQCIDKNNIKSFILDKVSKYFREKLYGGGMVY